MRYLLLTALVWLLPPSHAFAQTAEHGDSMGALSPFLALGDDEGWRGSISNGAYWLENRSDPGAVRYYYAASPRDWAAERGLSIDVDISGAGEGGGAGLLFGLSETPRRYAMVVLRPGGEVEVMERDQDGLHSLLATTLQLPDRQWVTLSVNDNQREAEIFVEDERVASYNSSAVVGDSAGIAALGMGRFGYRNFRDSADRPISGQTETTATTATTAPSGTQSNAQPNQQSTTGAQRFRETAIKDKGRGDIAAYHVFVPEGWQVEGEFQAVPGYPMLPYLGEYRIQAPDGRFVSFTPLAEFGFSDYAQAQPFQPFQGRPWFRQPPSIGDFTIAMAQLAPTPTMTNLKVLSEEVMDEATEYVRRNAANSYQGARQYTEQNSYAGERYDYDVHVRKLVLEFDQDGKRMESTTFATVASNVIRLANGSVKTAMWTLTNAYSIGGPKGVDYAADPQLAAIVRSNRVDPEWAKSISLWYQNNGKKMIAEGLAAAAAARQSASARIQESEDVLDISFNGWKNRGAMTDAGQTRLVNSIHEQTTYATPGGGQVNLPSFYQHAYTDGQGNYVLHNDANYNIATDPSMNARDWQAVAPVN